MAQDDTSPRAPDSYAPDDPTRSLIKDHDYLRQLFQRYLSSQDDLVKRQAGPQICETLQRHFMLEEAVFYPHVKAVDPAMVEQCEAEHQQADHLLVQLQKLQPGETAYDGLMKQLRDAIIAHIDVEENQLFPAVRQSAMDLQDLALRMQAYESTLISSQAASGKGPQPGSPLH